ncbi:response regulator [Pseudaestuariivita rosea]|uniref:response regulator n=1 Tax=Pseudaestuariivita rosea TaxID=2763263 RepID=UPI001ABA540B|nr:response regulator [Pseudaestuariivita rosea]
MKVLVVEDDAALSHLWCEVFEGAQHVCFEAASPEDARKTLMTTSFDLVVLDLYLGSDTGLSVATLATYKNPNCKVIVVTGSTVFPRGELFDMDPAIASVLRKPVDISELLAVGEHCVAHDQPQLMS